MASEAQRRTYDYPYITRITTQVAAVAQGNPFDPRLIQAFELLRDVLDGPSNTVPSHWQLDLVPPPDAQGVLSATDLLGLWFRLPGNAAKPWDAYFGQAPASSAHNLGTLLTPGEHPAFPGTVPGANSVMQHVLKRFLNHPEDEIADDDADAVVECLYRFLHALAVRHVESAMREVAEDYHVIEDDHEIDKLGLRQQCESLLDDLHGCQLQISLAQIPEPIPHPLGVIVDATIQIDVQGAALATPLTRIVRRLAVFRRALNDSWQIVALAKLNDDRTDGSEPH